MLARLLLMPAEPLHKIAESAGNFVHRAFVFRLNFNSFRLVEHVVVVRTRVNCFSLRLRNEPLLGIHVHVAFRAERANRRVAPVFAQRSQLFCVGKANATIFDNPVFKAFVFDFPRNFDAFVEVSRHQIGTRQNHFDLAVHRAEDVYPRMFEKSPNNAHDANVVRVALNARQNARNPAHQACRHNACLRGFHQLVDDVFVGDRIRFHENARRETRTLKCNLVVNFGDEVLLDLHRRHPKRLIFV